MKEKIDRVVIRWVQLERLVVQYIGQPSEQMPVFCMNGIGCECPSNILRRDAIL
jgi:hypothetical protein